MISITLEEIVTNLLAIEIYALFQNETESFFLDSSLENPNISQFSFIGIEPFLIVKSTDSVSTLQQAGKEYIIKDNPFFIIKDLLKKYTMVNTTKFPFVGGAVGFYSYELNKYIDYSSKKRKGKLRLPDMIVGFYDHVIIVDHNTKKTFLTSVNHDGRNAKDRQILKDKIIQKITKKVSLKKKKSSRKLKQKSIISNVNYAQYQEMIKQAKKYISFGHIYQVNLSQQFKAQVDEEPFSIYLKLRKYNPAPYSAYFNYGSFQILSSSPERFLRIWNGCVETKPIKGTFPRGNTSQEDEKNKIILQKSIKNHAENYMIVDLLRNDLGKVCEFGTVYVSELCAVESYATVHHLVSTIIGKLREGVDAIDCFMACFPGGSITGAPKIRAMEIIDELESLDRHIYTGSLGYIGFDGNADFNIAIRTVLIHQRNAYYHVGGGIVWDSTAKKEYQETLYKGKALKRALQL